MAEIKRLVETSQLNTKQWMNNIVEGKQKSVFYYNPEVDAFTLLFDDPAKPRVVHYIDEHVALLYEPDTLEIVGVRVEAFERAFLPQYARLEKTWNLKDKQVKLTDLWDLTITVQMNQPIVTKEISKITHTIAKKRGLELPVPA